MAFDFDLDAEEERLRKRYERQAAADAAVASFDEDSVNRLVSINTLYRWLPPGVQYALAGAGFDPESEEVYGTAVAALRKMANDPMGYGAVGDLVEPAKENRKGGWLSKVGALADKVNPVTLPQRAAGAAARGEMPTAPEWLRDNPVTDNVLEPAWRQTLGNSYVKGAARAATAWGDAPRQLAQGGYRVVSSGYQRDGIGGAIRAGANLSPLGLSPIEVAGVGGEQGIAARFGLGEQLELGQIAGQIGEGIREGGVGGALSKVDTGSGYFVGGRAKADQNTAEQRWGTITYADGTVHARTIGRDFAGLLAEPGTRPYNALSGAADFLVAIGSDMPFNAAQAARARPFTELSIGKRTAAALEEGRDATGLERMLDSMGGLRGGARRTVSPEKVDWWLNTKLGNAYVEDIAESTSLSQLNRAFNGKLDPETLLRLKNTSDPTETKEILKGVLGVYDVKAPTRALQRFGFELRTSDYVPDRLRQFNARLPDVGEHSRDLESPREAFTQLKRQMDYVHLDEATQDVFLERLASATNRYDRSLAFRDFDNHLIGKLQTEVGMSEAGKARLSKIMQRAEADRLKVDINYPSGPDSFFGVRIADVEENLARVQRADGTLDDIVDAEIVPNPKGLPAPVAPSAWASRVADGDAARSQGATAPWLMTSEEFNLAQTDAADAAFLDNLRAAEPFAEGVDTPLFHGTGRAFEGGRPWNFGGGGGHNLYGPGLYLTDDPVIAKKYTKKVRGEDNLVYEVKWRGGDAPRIITEKDPIPPSTEAMIRGNLNAAAEGGWGGDIYEEDLNHVLSLLDRKAPIEEVYPALREILRAGGWRRDAADELFFEWNYNMAVEDGFDLLKHQGGVRAGKGKHLHNAYVVLDVEKVDTRDTTHLRPTSADHKAVVADALSRGEPVPQAVLDEYPDLVEQFAAPPPSTDLVRISRGEVDTDGLLGEIVDETPFTDDDWRTILQMRDNPDIATPSLLAEHIGRYMGSPDLVEARRQLGNFKWLYDHGLDQPASWARNAQGIWKKSVIFRPALALRVIGEIQTAMTLSGVPTLINHPLTAIAWVLGDNPRRGPAVQRLLRTIDPDAARRAAKGSVSIMGTEFDDLKRFKDVMGDHTFYERFDKDAVKMNYFPLHHKTDATWLDAATGNLRMMRADPAVQKAAEMMRDGLTLDDFKAWFWNSPEGVSYREQLSRLHRNDGGERILDLAGASEFAEGWVWKSLRRATGDNPDLIAAVSDGHINGVRMFLEGAAENPEFTKRMEAYRDFLPDAVPGPRTLQKAGQGHRFTDALNTAYDYSMDVIFRNREKSLVRSPQLRQFYYEAAMERANYLKPEFAQRFTDNLMAAGMKKGEVRQAGYYAKRALPEGMEGLTLTQLDDLAWGHAVDKMQFYLEDLVNRKQWTKSLEVLSPFVHVWSESSARWLKIMASGTGPITKIERAFNVARDPQVGDMLGVPADVENVTALPGAPVAFEETTEGQPQIWQGEDGKWRIRLGASDNAFAGTAVFDSMNPKFAELMQSGAFVQARQIPKGEGVEILQVPGQRWMVDDFDAGMSYTFAGDPNLPANPLVAVGTIPRVEGAAPELIVDKAGRFVVEDKASGVAFTYAKDPRDANGKLPPAMVPMETGFIQREGQGMQTTAVTEDPQWVVEDKANGIAFTFTQDPRQALADTVSKKRGLFYRDQFGQEAMAFPLSGSLMNALGWGAPIPLRGRVSGLNMAFEVTPGVGPVASIPLSFLDSTFDDPKYDGIRSLVEAVAFPRGVPDGGVADQIVQGSLPSWARRISNRDDPSNVINALYYLSSSGRFNWSGDGASVEEINRMVNEAQQIAGATSIMSAIASGITPTAPSAEWFVENEGKNLPVYTLLADMRKMREEDPQNATLNFIAKYGDNAAMLLVGKTIATTPGVLPPTKEADKWLRANSWAQSEYNNVYGMLAPQGGDFDSSTYDKIMRFGDREKIDPELVPLWANDMVAKALYYSVRNKLPDPSKPEQAAVLSQYREQLLKEYPGFNPYGPPEGKVEKIAPATLIRDLERAANDERFAGNKAVEPLKQYLDFRNQIVQASEVVAPKTSTNRKDWWLNSDTQQAAELRNMLHAFGRQLVAETPDFTSVFEDGLMPEYRGKLATDDTKLAKEAA